MATVEVLPGLPAEPPYAEQFAPVGVSTFREGHVLGFEPKVGEPWCGNFQMAGISYYCAHHALATGEVVVVAGGQGYVIDPESRRLIRTFGAGIMHLRALPGERDFIVISNVDVERHSASTRTWRSRRIAWDGIGRVEIVGPTLVGQARHFDDSWHEFRVDLASGTHVGGAYADF